MVNSMINLSNSMIYEREHEHRNRDKIWYIDLLSYLPSSSTIFISCLISMIVYEVILFFTYNQEYSFAYWMKIVVILYIAFPVYLLEYLSKSFISQNHLKPETEITLKESIKIFKRL